ncbi:CAP domain-containing protein [Streptomyces flavofungini]|uniref:CAP domain-containing protein n=1 Tax=Streptomyces flavofungini TaxID=68200 RepID=UPI0034DF4063
MNEGAERATGPRRPSWAACALAVATLLGCAHPAWAGPPPAQATRAARIADDAPGHRTALRVLAAVNRSRDRAGCAPVHLSVALTRAAESHSVHMARNRRLSHAGAGSSTPAERVRASGYRAQQTAENIAAGPDTPEAVVAAWLDSPSHREAMLTCGFTHAGVGAAAGAVHSGAGPWWTLDLAESR